MTVAAFGRMKKERKQLEQSARILPRLESDRKPSLDGASNVMEKQIEARDCSIFHEPPAANRPRSSGTPDETSQNIEHSWPDPA